MPTAREAQVAKWREAQMTKRRILTCSGERLNVPIEDDGKIVMNASLPSVLAERGVSHQKWAESVAELTRLKKPQTVFRVCLDVLLCLTVVGIPIFFLWRYSIRKANGKALACWIRNLTDQVLKPHGMQCHLQSEFVGTELRSSITDQDGQNRDSEPGFIHTWLSIALTAAEADLLLEEPVCWKLAFGAQSSCPHPLCPYTPKQFAAAGDSLVAAVVCCHDDSCTCCGQYPTLLGYGIHRADKDMLLHRQY